MSDASEKNTQTVANKKMTAFAVFVFMLGLVRAKELYVSDGITDSKMVSLVKSYIEADKPPFGPDGMLVANLDLDTSNVDILENIVRNMKTQNDANEFLQSKGMEKIVSPVLKGHDISLAERVVVIIEKMFMLIPSTMTVIPYSYLEKVIDAFASNTSPVINRHAVEVIRMWMLKHPEAQTHMINEKRVRAFQQQLPYYDADVFSKLVRFVTELIKEHIDVREDVKKIEMSDETKDKYLKMGVLEAVETYETCIGIVGSFDEHIPEWGKMIVQIIDLLKTTKKFCSEKYKENYDVIITFESLLKFVSDDSKLDYYRVIGLNVKYARQFLEEYITEISQKSEL